MRTNAVDQCIRDELRPAEATSTAPEPGSRCPTREPVVDSNYDDLREAMAFAMKPYLQSLSPPHSPGVTEDQIVANLATATTMIRQQIPSMQCIHCNQAVEIASKCKAVGQHNKYHL